MSTQAQHPSGETRPEIVVRAPGCPDLRVIVVERLEIGRDCAGLLLDDAAVSRRHLAIAPRPDGLVASDLGSSNGSTLNGSQLTEAGEPLRPGDVIVIGGTRITIDRVGDGADPPARAVDITSLTTIERVASAARTDIPPIPDDWGTVTIVFTDIESSTDHGEALGDERWHALLADHNRMVSAVVDSHGGRIVKSLGDGFLMIFSGARQAIDSMIELQHDIPTLGEQYGRDFRVRVGLHTGEVITGDDGDVFGHHVVMAARVSDKADGGEILVSSLVRSIIESRGDLTFGESRDVDLKGLGASHSVHPVLY